MCFSWTVEEHWSRTVRESYTDSKGRRRTRTRRESGWKTVADGGDMTPFYLQDDTGVIRILPARAKIEPLTVFSETCRRSDPLYYEKGPRRAVSHSDHRRRFRETAIPLHTPLYVVGKARERQDIVAPEIAYDADALLFLISTGTEKAVTRKLGWIVVLWTVLGLVLWVAGFVCGTLRSASIRRRGGPNTRCTPRSTDWRGYWAGAGWCTTPSCACAGGSTMRGA